jgi:hypothetical protein
MMEEDCLSGERQVQLFKKMAPLAMSLGCGFGPGRHLQCAWCRKGDPTPISSFFKISRFRSTASCG